MKQSPQNKKLEEILRSSKISAGGFLGQDTRNLEEIIAQDLCEVSRLGYNMNQIVDRMRWITNKARQGLGNWVEIDDKIMAMTDEARGTIPCPFMHPRKFAKRFTIVKFVNSEKTLKWSDLNIHLMDEHGFFEGKGTMFRIEPKDLIEMIF